MHMLVMQMLVGRVLAGARRVGASCAVSAGEQNSQPGDEGYPRYPRPLKLSHPDRQFVMIVDTCMRAGA